MQLFSLFFFTGLANEAMDERRSWTTLSSSTNAGNLPSSVVVDASSTEKSDGKSLSSSSKNEVVELDEDDDDSHFLC